MADVGLELLQDKMISRKILTGVNCVILDGCMLQLFAIAND